MKLYTSYFGNVARITKCFSSYYTDVKLHFVNIAKYPSKELEDVHSFSELQPSENLLLGLKRKKITHKMYDYTYLDNLEHTISCNTIWDKCFKLFGNNQIVIFLCYERPSDHCYRHLFRNYMNEGGFEVCEFPAHPATINKLLDSIL